MITLLFANDGPAIASTNYWNSEYARNGLCFLTWNAGTARLLIPNALKSTLREMQGADYVVVSRGRSHLRPGQDALEILFEDGSNAPFAVTLDLLQTDCLFEQDTHGARFTLAVWTHQGRKLCFPARYRIAPELPCLQPWA